jgi:hypothetical protein
MDDIVKKCKLVTMAWLCSMLISPLLANDGGNWKVSKVEDGITLYVKDAINGLIPFKARANLKLPIDQVAKVLMDFDHKHKWSPKLKSVKVHEQINEHQVLFSEYYKTPWPSMDREFLMHGRVEGVGSSEVTFSARSVSKESLITKYASDKHIQAEVFSLHLTLSKLGESATSIAFEFRGDLKGWMPKWLTNLIQERWPKLFIEGLDAYAREQSRLALGAQQRVEAKS